MTPPTRAIVREWLRRLAVGEATRSEVADLARPWVAEREREVTDAELWAPLARMAGADIESAPCEYLYNAWDFETWLSEFELHGVPGTDPDLCGEAE